MKKLVILAMVFASLSFTAQAQHPGNGHQPPTPEQRTERLAEQLGLSDDQKAKVLELNTEYKDMPMMGGFGGHHGNGHGNGNGQRPQVDGQSGATQQHQRPELTEEQKAKFEEMRKKREEYDAKLKAILTDDQKAKYDQMHSRGGHGNGHGNANGHSKDKGDKGNKGGKNK